jgi:NAD(P)-dependent dehydrogenase (short-subunit alcohol dehydrogenase family)
MRALVTGGSYGIGGATCLRLARDAIARGEPAKIVVSATGARPDLAELVDELKSLGAEAKSVVGDLADRDFPQRLVDEAVAFCGGLDALVCNAGSRYKGMLLDIPTDDWDRVYAINIRAPWLLAKAAHPALKASRGAIVMVTSLAATHPLFNYGPYSTTKAALVMLVQQMANEWAPDGIRVNGVAPGSTMTREKSKVKAAPEVEAKRMAALPMGRVADPAEQASVIAFLLGKDASYISGHNIVVDGAFGSSLMHFSAGSHSNVIRQT